MLVSKETVSSVSVRTAKTADQEFLLNPLRAQQPELFGLPPVSGSGSAEEAGILSSALSGFRISPGTILDLEQDQELVR